MHDNCGGRLSKRKDKHRIGERIDAPQLRVIDGDGNMLGIISRQEALTIAKDSGLDLVEVSPQAAPPVCRIMNYGKFIFQMRKKQQDARKKQRTFQVKEMKFRPRIDDHDFNFKVKNLKKFLGKGDKVRAFVHFRGREMAHKELGMKIMQRVKEECAEIATVEKHPAMEGNRMFMTLAPLPPEKTGKN